MEIDFYTAQRLGAKGSGQDLQRIWPEPLVLVLADAIHVIGKLFHFGTSVQREPRFGLCRKR